MKVAPVWMRQHGEIKMSLTDDILEMVTIRKNVSFVELSRLDGFRGTCTFEVNNENCSNIVFWSGISEEAFDALRGLIDRNKIHPKPAHLFSYMADGRVLRLPLAKSARHYKEPHWLPVVFNPGSETPRRSKRARR